MSTTKTDPADVSADESPDNPSLADGLRALMPSAEPAAAPEPEPAAAPAPPPIDTMPTGPKVKTPEEVDEVLQDWKDAATSAEMEPYRPQLLPSASAWQAMRAIAEDLAVAATMPSSLRNKPADVALLLLVARDVGIKPSTAINRIHVIDGRPSMSSELMRGLVLERGHDLWFEDVTDTSVTIVAHRAGWPEERVARVTWTIEMAQAAGLSTKDAWKKYPRSMLKARATSEICRDVFPDVLLGVSYTPEELDVDVDADGEPLKVQSSWSRNASDAPVYQPAPQVVIDAFQAQIDSMGPEAKKALGVKWKELKLRPLKVPGPDSKLPEGHMLRQLLSVEEIDLASVAIQEVLRTVAEDAEIVHEEPAAEPEAAVVDADSEESPQEMIGLRARVADLAPSQVIEFLQQFENVTIPTAEEDQREKVIEIMYARVRCENCDGLLEGEPMKGEALCGCDDGPNQ